MDDFWEILRRLIEDYMRTGELDPERLLSSRFFVYSYTVTAGPGGEPHAWGPEAAQYPEAGLEEVYVEARDLGDRVEVLAHLPGYTPDQVSVEVERGRRSLILRAGKNLERVELPARIAGLAEKSFKNGVLRLVFKKKRGLLPF